MQKQIPFEPGNYFYLRTQTIANDNAFNCPSDYSHFLSSYCRFFMPLTKTVAYSLMPNQFHFLFMISNNKTLIKRFEKNQVEFSKSCAKQFGNVLSSYGQAFNLYHERKGGLFIRPCKRDLIHDHEHLMDLIKHIHLLPVEYGLTDHPSKWKHSSYPLIINKRASFLHTNEFRFSTESLKKFELFHESISDIKPAFQIPQFITPLKKAA